MSCFFQKGESSKGVEPEMKIRDQTKSIPCHTVNDHHPLKLKFSATMTILKVNGSMPSYVK